MTTHTVFRKKWIKGDTDGDTIIRNAIRDMGIRGYGDTHIYAFLTWPWLNFKGPEHHYYTLLNFA